MTRHRDELYRQADLARRRPREGDRRRRDTPPSITCAGFAHGFVVSRGDRQGPHPAHRRCATRSRSTACSTCSRTSTGRSSPPRDDNTATRSRRPARLSGRSTTTRSRSTASRSRWWSPRSSRSRALPPRSCASSTSRTSTSPTSTAQRAQRRGRRTASETRPAQPRQCRRGVRAGAGTHRGRIPHADRAPQSDGDVRDDRGVGRRWPDHGLRQDPGRAEHAATTSPTCSACAPNKVRVLSPYRRRRVRLRPAAAIPAAARRAGGAGAQALGAGRADAPADVHPRLPRRQHPDAGAGGRSRRPPCRVPPRRARHDLAVRGLPAQLSSTGRASSTAAPTSSSARSSSSST